VKRERMALAVLVHGACPGFAGVIYAVVLDMSEACVFAAGCARAGYRIHYINSYSSTPDKLTKLLTHPPALGDDPSGPQTVRDRALYEVHQFREAN